MDPIIRIIAPIINSIANIPHNGAVIHHHDQVIILVNFKIENIMKSKNINIVTYNIPLDILFFND